MAILTVGTGQQYATLSAAAAASRDGDTIYVKAGTYVNDFTTTTTKLNIVGVGGLAHFVATVSPPNGKAIITTDNDISFDHVELSGASVPDQNGAGIRHEFGNLTVTNSYIHDNEDGILTNAIPGKSVVIDHSEFDHNGFVTGQAHNIYVTAAESLTVTNSYMHDAIVGHELKSRAQTNLIENNRIFDNDGSASYSIDLPNGGNGTIRNNIIQQGPNSQNSVIMTFAEEGSAYPNPTLSVTGNTIINNEFNSGYALVNRSTAVASVTGNHLYGVPPAQVVLGPSAQSNNDTLATAPALDTSHPWAASPWDQLISGGAGNDTLNGTAGRDLVVGGAGNDTFNIVAGGGSDTIADFAAGAGAGDVVKLTGYSFSDFASVQGAMTQNGADTVLKLNATESLTFQNTQKSAFAADDFGFGSGGGGGGGGGGTMTPIESAGVTTLATSGGHYYLLGSGGTGPSLKYGGADVSAGQFPGWTPIGAEKTASGYEIAWKNAGAGQYILWNTDNAGAYASNVTGAVAGTDPAIVSAESTFQQDLNGDGQIGSSSGGGGGGGGTMTPIESAGATTLATSGGHYYLLDGSGTGPSLKYSGADVTAGQFAGWTPIGAEKTGSGYEIAWKNAGSSQYTLWDTDNSGAYTGNVVNIASGSDPAIISAESVFQQDLNGDGKIGTGSAMTPIETAGVTTLASSASHYYLLNSSGAGPSLKYGGADVTAGQFAGWTPIGGEKTSSGYEIAWKNAGSGLYTLWNTDNTGAYTGNVVNVASGSDGAIISAENVFHQDLNGDGKIGSGASAMAAQQPVAETLAAPSVPEASAVAAAEASGNDAFVFSASDGADIQGFQIGQNALDLQRLFHPSYGSGTDPAADHAPSLTVTVAGLADILHGGVLHNIVDIQNASLLHHGTDILWS